jgi:hypothetical protein
MDPNVYFHRPNDKSQHTEYILLVLLQLSYETVLPKDII